MGVREGGEGEDGRMKSGIGMGGVVGDGMGDRVGVRVREEGGGEIGVGGDVVD